MLLRNKETASSIFQRIFRENRDLYKSEFRLVVFSIHQTAVTMDKNDMDIMRELSKSINFPNQMNNIIFDNLGNIKHYSVTAMTDIGKTIESESRVYTVK